MADSSKGLVIFGSCSVRRRPPTYVHTYRLPMTQILPFAKQLSKEATLCIWPILVNSKFSHKIALIKEQQVGNRFCVNTIEMTSY